MNVGLSFIVVHFLIGSIIHLGNWKVFHRHLEIDLPNHDAIIDGSDTGCAHVNIGDIVLDADFLDLDPVTYA